MQLKTIIPNLPASKYLRLLNKYTQFILVLKRPEPALCQILKTTPGSKKIVGQLITKVNKKEQKRRIIFFLFKNTFFKLKSCLIKKENKTINNDNPPLILADIASPEQAAANIR